MLNYQGYVCGSSRKPIGTSVFIANLLGCTWSSHQAIWTCKRCSIDDLLWETQGFRKVAIMFTMFEPSNNTRFEDVLST